LLFDDLTGYTKKDDPPLNNYGSEDEVEKTPGVPYYFYIGIKPINGYKIATGGQSGSWLVIDWDQDLKIDFDDHNGNSAGSGKNQGYSTQFAQTPDGGVEWAIPYLDEYEGICQSPFWITIHIEIVLPGSCQTETTTFPDRPPGKFLSAEICVGDLVKPEEPPEPGEWGIRTIGFWKHQFNTALGIQKGHQHVPTADLLYYLGEVSSQSTIPELQLMDSDMLTALALLELRGKHVMYDRAVQQLLATWLNYVSGNDMWDSDGDGIPDENLIDVITWAEAMLLDGDPTNDEEVKDYLDKLNNSGD
jgi:hypothetical protein